MKIQIAHVMFLSLMIWRISIAQTTQPLPDSTPASTNVPRAQYPQLDSEGRGTFRISAPNVKQVRINIGGNGTHNMTKGEDGVWSITTRPLVPGFHYYWFIFDGVNVNDPASETFFGVSRNYSGIDVPEKGVDFYDIKNVPHGEIRSKWYFSKVTNAWRQCFVYTPPDYDTNPTARYPVLYLQHGGGEDQRGWVIQGRVNFIVDNLIAAGKAKPFIIVMDNGGGGMGGGRGRGAPGARGPASMPAGGSAVAGAPATQPGGRAGGRGGFGAGNLAQIMTQELIPTIDSTYRTIADQPNRGMAGLSMGGMQTRSVTFEHLDKFSHIGIFSAGGAGDPATGPMADVNAFNSKVKVLFLSVGSTENPANVKNNHETLKAAGIKNVYYEAPGTAHEWQTWRKSIYELAPLLFRN